ncbi:MAG TPA: FtsX-like permease family protein [Prolixibacteraceae bacterium]|nr:FtsX-like permease family protein [Prolixibacteraceae bacterium]
MNTELFIARRIFTQKENKKGISNKIVSIAVGSISLGLAVMIIAVAILIGFKKQIRNKVIGFGSHFQVVNFDSNQSYETQAITIDSSLIKKYLSLPHISHIQLYATKPGLIKTDTEIHGMIVKGVSTNYDLSFFKQNLISGTIPKYKLGEKSNNAIISEKIAKSLKLKTGDPLYCYFYNQGESTPRSRKLNICGIYRTSLEEFDDMFVIADLRLVQGLNNWNESEISGYEILIDDFDQLEYVLPELRDITLNSATEESTLKVFSIKTRFPMLFDWLSVLDLNVWVLLILMIAVAGINMISGVLIIIIERTRMIGVLKALGYPNFNVRKVFLYLSGFLSARGLLWGNVVGVSVCLFQYFTGILKLNPELYYIDTVPISLNLFYLLLLNIGTLICITAMTIIPSFFISKITPAEAIAIE